MVRLFDKNRRIKFCDIKEYFKREDTVAYKIGLFFLACDFIVLGIGIIFAIAMLFPAVLIG